MSATEAPVTKRCSVCGRFRAYEADDQFCVGCGHATLESECDCGRSFDYALGEPGPVHCPRCGRPFSGRDPEYE